MSFSSGFWGSVGSVVLGSAGSGCGFGLGGGSRSRAQSMVWLGLMVRLPPPPEAPFALLFLPIQHLIHHQKSTLSKTLIIVHGSAKPRFSLTFPR